MSGLAPLCNSREVITEIFSGYVFAKSRRGKWVFPTSNIAVPIELYRPPHIVAYSDQRANGDQRAAVLQIQ